MFKLKYHYFLILTVGVVVLLALFLLVESYDFTIPDVDEQITTIDVDGVLHPVEVLSPGDVSVYGVRLVAATKAFADVNLDGDVVRIPLGDTVPFADIVITLYESDVDRAGFVMVPNEVACGQKAEQTQLCRGGSACCSGQCVELECAADTMCGDRPLYCCNGKLSFTECVV